MADTKITGLTGTSSPDDAAEFAANEGGNDRKYTRAEICAKIQAEFDAYETNNDAAVVLKAALGGAIFTGAVNTTATTMTVAAPVAATSPTTKTYVDTADALKVSKNGDTMTGLVILSGDPSNVLGAATKQYVDTADALGVLKGGSTMTGPLILSGDPSNVLGAATKQYVDAVTTAGMAAPSTLACAANPNYPAANAGATYQVTSAGKVGGASGIVVEIDDLIICVSTSAGGTEAAVGTEWMVLQNNLVVSSTTAIGKTRYATSAEVQNEAISADVVAAVDVQALLAHQTAMRQVTVLPNATSSPTEAQAGYLIVTHDIVAGSAHDMTLPDPSALVNPTLCTYVVMCGIDGAVGFDINFDDAGGNNVNGVGTYVGIAPDHPLICVNDGADWYVR
jgi:hypothetical protein